MSGSLCVGAGCGAQLATGWFLCHECTLDLEFQLHRVFDVYGTVLTSLQRRDAGARSLGNNGRKPGSVEPVNLAILDHVMTLQAVLTGWAAQVPTMRPASREPHHVAAWMLQPATMALIRRQEWAYDFALEVADALHPLAKAVERPGPRLFAGTCPTTEDQTECGTQLYAAPGRPIVVCRKCGADWDVTDWRARALEAAGYHAGTPAEVSRLLADPITGAALPSNTIHTWVARGKLTPIGHNRHGKPVYQVRKVRALWVRSLKTNYVKKRAA